MKFNNYEYLSAQLEKWDSCTTSAKDDYELFQFIACKRHQKEIHTAAFAVKSKGGSTFAS